MAVIGSLGKVITNTVKNVGNILKDPASLATIALMAWINPVGTLGYLASAAVYTGVMAFTSALSPTPDMPNLDTNAFVSEAQGRTQTIKQPAQPRKVAYGRTRIGGVITFISTEGKKNKFLHMIVTYTGHEIEEFEQHVIDDKEVVVKANEVTTPSRFLDGKTKLVRIYERLGTDDQTAITSFVNTFKNFTKDHRQRGCALVGYRFQFNDKAYPNGLPRVSAIVKGVKLYDPRTGLTQYSDNAALCIYDYLTNTSYGMGLTSSEIDIASFQTAASVCDESVTLANGGTRKRYTCNGSFSVNKSHRAVVTELLTTCGGQLTYQNGKFTLTVAEARTPVLTITEDDLIEGVDIKTKQSIGEQYNTVKGTYVYGEGSAPPFVPTDYKKVTSSVFLTEDNNVERVLDFSFPFTTNSAEAQRLAKIILYRSRQAITLSTKTTLKSFNLKAGDWVYVTLPRFGWTNKVFEVASWTITPVASETLGVELLLRETNSAVFDWDAEEEEFILDDSDLPDPFSILPPIMVVGQSLATNNQKATTNLDVTVTAQDLYGSTFEVFVKQIAPTVETEIALGRGSTNLFQYPDVATGSTWQVRARAYATVGTISNFVTDTITIAGKSALSLPSNVEDLSLNYIGGNAVLTWTPVTDPDLSHYHVRHQAVTSGGSFANGIDLANKVARPANSAVVPAISGTYFVAAVDKYGNISGTAASTIGIIDQNPSTVGFALLDTVTEDFATTAFAGTKTDCLIDVDTGNTLILDTSNLFDSVSGNFDDASGLFDGGDGFVSASGTYEFSNSYIDLGTRQQFRVIGSNITYTRLQYGTATASTNAGCNVVMQVSVTDDDPTASPSWSTYQNVVVGDFTARAARFRLLLTSSTLTDTPQVSQAVITLHAQLRTETGQDIGSGTSGSGKVVTFTNGFNTLQGLGIAGQNLLSGEFYAITSKSATGFTIIFRDNANNPVDRTFDFVASGAGYIP